jgi:hypothetical protein
LGAREIEGRHHCITEKAFCSMNNVLGWFRQFDALVILRAVRICYMGKNKPIDVQYFGSLAYWDWKDDTGFCKYSRALMTLQEHKIIWWLLKKVHAV